MTAPTVRVRIAVAVTPCGKWVAYGNVHDRDDATRKEGLFLDDLPEGEQVHFVEADVPIPERKTIEGEVVP